jgi:hypothetical protein
MSASANGGSTGSRSANPAEAGERRVRAALAEARNAHNDQIAVGSEQHVGPETHVLQRSRLVALDERVGAADETQQRLPGSGMA